MARRRANPFIKLSAKIKQEAEAEAERKRKADAVIAATTPLDAQLAINTVMLSLVRAHGGTLKYPREMLPVGDFTIDVTLTPADIVITERKP